MDIPWTFLLCLRGHWAKHAALVAENLALRHQLGVLQRSAQMGTEEVLPWFVGIPLLRASSKDAID